MRCRWEGAPTLVIIFAMGSAYLVSPHATRHVGPMLHRITAVWNLEDLLGHMLSIGCASAAVYMALIRFGTLPVVADLYNQWVTRPLTIAIPVLFGLFCLSDAESIAQFEDTPTTPAMTLYWIVFTATQLYLWGFAARLFLILRGRSASRTVLNMYLGATLATLACISALCTHALTDFDATIVMTASGATAAIGWAVAPAYSWAQRSRPLGISVDDSVPEIRRDSIGDAA